MSNNLTSNNLASMSGGNNNNLAGILDRRPLIGFQMDASHLHDILSSLIDAQAVHDRELSMVHTKMRGFEQTLSDFDSRLGVLEREVSSGGGGISVLQEELRGMQSALGEVSHTMANMSRSVIPDLAAQVEENRRVTRANDEGITAVVSTMQKIEEASDQTKNIAARAVDRLAPEMERVKRDMVSLNDRLLEQDAKVARGSSQDAQLLRDVAHRVDGLERLANQNREAVQAMSNLDELNRRTNENFKSVEISAKAVDGELSKIRSDLGNVRAEINQLDNNTRSKLGKITDDADGKFEMLLGLLKTFEKNSSMVEQHLAEAGRALVNPRAPSVAASPASSRMGNAPAASSSVPRGGGGGGTYTGSGGGGGYRGGSSGSYGML